MGRKGGKKLHDKKSSPASSASAFTLSYLMFTEWGMKHIEEMVTNESIFLTFLAKTISISEIKCWTVLIPGLINSLLFLGKS